MSATQPKLEDLCRFCAKFSDTAMPIFNADGNEEILGMIRRLVPFEIYSCDGLPQKSCETCLVHLKSFKQFLDACIQANEKLRNLSFLLSDEGCNSDEPSLTDSFGLGAAGESPKSVAIPAEEAHFKNEARSEESIKVHQNSRDETVHHDSDSQLHSALEAQPSAASLLCDICGKVFERANNLRVHKATHLEDALKKKHVCSTCGKRFFSRFQLTEHQNVHLGLKPHQCDLCDKKFHKRILLRQHKLIHLPESDLFECCKCGLKFNRKSNLKAHERTHSSTRSFACRVCSLTFGEMRSLLSHRRLEHMKKTEESVVVSMEHCCMICDTYFENADSLSQHMKTHKQKENKQAQCKICRQVVNTKALKYHEMSKHSNKRPFQCSYCSEESKEVGFMSFGLLKNHERLHTGQRPFKCDSCEKSFRSRKSLRQHKLKHSNLRNYECNFCTKRFKTKGTLKVHLKIHTGEKPYVCDLCGHSFIQKSDMMKHQRRHSNHNLDGKVELEPTTSYLLSKEHNPAVKTVDVAAVVLPEHVQKMLNLTNTSIFPGNFILADQHFTGHFPAESNVINSQQNEIKMNNSSEGRLVTSADGQDGPCIRENFNGNALSSLTAPSLMTDDSDIVITNLSLSLSGSLNSSSEAPS
ncbi:unnamed protein product [Bemisia tabaci]|uniref:Zinc finger protein n=1 Tax=Bemisia tabaci TaxID=7038 RepID=A0AAI8UPF7_BEMTA|nr:unnamed protein product [Bemisia tabaci]